MKTISTVIELLAVAFIILFPIIGKGQEVSLPGIHYDVEQGIPSSDAYCALKDHEGYLWFGTDAGVSRFNGYEFLNFTPADGLTDNSIFALREDTLGRIWYLPFNGRIGFIQNDIIYPYAFNEQIKLQLGQGDFIRYLVCDSAQHLKFVTSNGQLGEVDTKGNVELWSTARGGYNELCFTNTGDESFGYFLRSETNQLGKLQVIDEKYKIDTLLNVAERGNLGFRYTGSSIIFFSYGSTLIMKNGPLLMMREIDATMTCAAVTNKGKIWVATRDQGMAVYESAEAFMKYQEPEYRLFNGINISHILTEDNGTIWVCLENQGVHCLKNENIKSYVFQDSKESNKIASVCSNSRKEVFYACRSGEVYKIDTTGKHQLFTSGYGDITQIEIQNNDHLIISSYLKKEALGESHLNLTNFSGRGFTLAKNGDLWKIKSIGLEQEHLKETVYNSVDGQGKFFFHVVFEDAEGLIWAGGNEGLFYFNKQELVPITEPFRKFGNVKVKCIAQLKDGTLVIGTAGDGIFFIKKKGTNFTSKNIPLDGFIIQDVHIDDDQDIWLATNGGLISLHENSVGALTQRVISHIHGLPANEVNSVISIGQTIYAGTNKGLAIFKKEDLQKNTSKIPLFMNRVSVNEEQVPLDSNYRLSSTENYIEFAFTGLSYRNPGNVEYGYKLVGIDEQWQYTKSREMRYPSLAPNDYTFMVKAVNEDGVWCKPSVINFTIRPPFWREPAFLLFCFFLLLVLVDIIFRQMKKNRIKKLIHTKELERQKRRIIEAELRALRAQMNPHFTFNTLNSIQNFITNFDPEKARAYISSFSLLLRKVLENSRYRTITIEEEIDMLTLYIDLENLRFDESIEYMFLIDDRIETDFQEIPSMIIQPFIENSILHGISGKREGEKKILVEMILKEDHILCIVEDTGIGRTKSAQIQKRKGLNHKSLGLKIANERLLLFNRERGNELSYDFIDLYDDHGKPRGTRVEIYFGLAED